jgi:CDP-diacylglycerol---glycerol-3-phosphate 3-phosphatidyltransferase
MTARVDPTTISLLFGGVTVIIGAAASLPSYVPAARWSFATIACLAWLFLAFRIARLRHDHSSAGEKSPAPISGPTWLTIGRGFLIALVAAYAAGAAEGPARWAPGALYTLAAVLDAADGALARRTARVTSLGAKLDVVTDALGLFVAPIVGVRWGRLPPWYLALGAAYPAFQVALEARRALGWPVFTERLRVDPRARFFAGVQMVVVAASLFPVLPRGITWTAATLAMLPTLALFAGEWRLVTASATNSGARTQRLDV